MKLFIYLAIEFVIAFILVTVVDLACSSDFGLEENSLIINLFISLVIVFINYIRK
jgi:hypothetical protein